MFCVLIWGDKFGSLPFDLTPENKLPLPLGSWSSQIFWGASPPPHNRLNALMGRPPPRPSSCRFASRTQQAWRGGAHALCRDVVVPGDICWLKGKAQGFLLRIWMDSMDDVNYVFHVKHVIFWEKYVSASIGWKCLAWRMRPTHTHTHQEKV